MKELYVRAFGINTLWLKDIKFNAEWHRLDHQY